MKRALIIAYYQLERELGKNPTRSNWNDSHLTPSFEMIKTRFKTWGRFVKLCNKPKVRSLLSGIDEKQTFNTVRDLRTITDGYVSVYRPEHPNSRRNGYIFEHRLVMSNLLKRPLLQSENVHHINGNKLDNSIQNLELWATQQPSGQRVSDLVVYANDILARYGDLYK